MVLILMPVLALISLSGSASSAIIVESDKIQLTVAALKDISYFETTSKPNELLENWRWIRNNTALMAIRKTTLEIDCKAKFPVEWNITGDINYPETVVIQPYKREIDGDGTPTFVLKLIIFFSDHENHSSSATVGCQSVDKPEVLKSFDVFLRGPKPFVNSGKHIRAFDTNVIPCPITDPTLAVTLYKQPSNGMLEPVSDPEYNPRWGFVFRNKIQGTFTCNTTEDSVIVSIDDYEISKINESPKMMTVFVGQKVLVSCISRSDNPGSIKIPNPENISITDQISTEPKPGVTKTTISITSSSGGNVTAVCEDYNGTVIFKHAYQFIDSPELYLDNHEFEVDCLTDIDSRSISSVRCIHPSHCNWMRKCFENPSSCDKLKQIHFHSKDPTRCWVEPKKMGRSCASVPYYHFNGMAQCKTNELLSNWMFFVGLDYRRYSDWTIAPRNALVKIETREEQNATVILCQAVSFLFTDTLRFSVVFGNGTESFLDDALYPPLEYRNPYTIDELNIASVINMENIPANISSIKCHAPWWNSTDYFVTEMKFGLRCL